MATTKSRLRGYCFLDSWISRFGVGMWSAPREIYLLRAMDLRIRDATKTNSDCMVGGGVWNCDNIVWRSTRHCGSLIMFTLNMCEGGRNGKSWRKHDPEHPNKRDKRRRKDCARQVCRSLASALALMQVAGDLASRFNSAVSDMCFVVRHWPQICAGEQIVKLLPDSIVEC